MTGPRRGQGSSPGARARDRDRLRLLATLADLRAEMARRPMALHETKLSALRKEIETLSATRARLRESVDAMSSGETAIGTAAYLSARSEDLRHAQADRYRTLAREEAHMAALKDTAARARARADVLRQLSGQKRC